MSSRCTSRLLSAALGSPNLMLLINDSFSFEVQALSSLFFGTLVFAPL